jgi:hypothetical protein
MQTEDIGTGTVYSSYVGGTLTVEEDVTGDESPCAPRMRGTASEECAYDFTPDQGWDDAPPEGSVTRNTTRNPSEANVVMEVRAGPPTPFFYHMRQLTLTITRSPYTYNCPASGCVSAELVEALDVVTIERFVPVLGVMVVSGDVPKTLTVPTRNRLVFNVLHGEWAVSLSVCASPRSFSNTPSFVSCLISCAQPQTLCRPPGEPFHFCVPSTRTIYKYVNG